MRNVILILLGVFIGAAIIIWVMTRQEEVMLAPTVTPTPTLPQQQPTPTPEAMQETGYIEGSLSYPSEGIPEDLKVCAETLQGSQIACTDEHIEDTEYKYGIGYKLEVPPGQYYVYAQLPNDDYRAYYNEFVECGLSVECDSHDLIAIEVDPGQTISAVDPGDWYNNQAQ